MRRRFMFASALVSLTVAAPAAWADRTVDSEITTPLQTSTAGDGGIADNIIITTDGRVTLSSAATAITLDSDHTVTVDGNIEVTSDDDGGVGVNVRGGNTGGLIINGDILVTSETVPTDDGEDEDAGFSDLDGPSAIGGNRVGVLIDGTGAFVGDIIMNDSGSITVRGNDSQAFSLLTELQGDISLDGIVSITGDRSTAINLGGDITGDVDLLASIRSTGEDSSGVVVTGDISGSFYFLGSISATGYRFAGRSTNEEFLATLDDDDKFQTGAGMILSSSIGGGVLIDSGNASLSNANEQTTMLLRGSAPVIEVRATDRDITFGSVVQPGVADNPDTDDVDETIDPLALNYSFVNRAALQAFGDLNDISTTGMIIGGTADGMGGFYTATLTDGLWNDGTITAISYFENDATASARGIVMDGGAVIPVFRNDGAITVTAFTVAQSENFGNGYAMIIESDAIMNTLINDGTIQASATGGSAFAIVDYSGTLDDVSNTGVIVGFHNPPAPFLDENDETVIPDDVPHQAVALDLSANTSGAQFRQYWVKDIVADDPDTADVDESLDAILVTDEVIRTRGDILLGSGADTVRLEAGTIEGAISFGDGSDLFILDGSAVEAEIELLVADGRLDPLTSEELANALPRYIGAITDSDGDLSIEVDHATLELTEGGNLQISQGRFGDGSNLIFEVDASSNQPRSITASGAVVFEQGSRLTISLSNLIGETGTYTVISGSDVTIEEGIASLTDEPTPYLYDTLLSFEEGTGGADDVITLSLNRRTADELGMHANQAAAYDSAFATWQSNSDLGEAMASLVTETEFFNAYNQLLPEYTVSAIQFARANNDIMAGALASRLDAVRRSPDDMGGLWLQEVGYYADREGTNFGSGYRGQGIGIAAGFDMPLGPFSVVGVNVMGSASEITQVEGVDNPMSALSGQIGAYAGADFAGLTFDLYAGAGIDSYEYNREIEIGSFSANPEADWDGHHYSFSARLAREFEFGRYFLRPSAGVNYISLFESAYEESLGGDGIDLSVDERETTSFSASGLMTFGARFGDDRSWWSPSARLGVRSEIENDTTETTARFVGYSDTFTLVSQQMPADGLIFGFGVTGGSQYSTFSLDYDGDIRDGYIRHAMRLVVRLVF